MECRLWWQSCTLGFYMIPEVTRQSLRCVAGRAGWAITRGPRRAAQFQLRWLTREPVWKFDVMAHAPGTACRASRGVLGARWDNRHTHTHTHWPTASNVGVDYLVATGLPPWFGRTVQKAPNEYAAAPRPLMCLPCVSQTTRGRGLQLASHGGSATSPKFRLPDVQ